MRPHEGPPCKTKKMETHLQKEPRRKIWLIATRTRPVPSTTIPKITKNMLYITVYFIKQMRLYDKLYLYKIWVFAYLKPLDSFHNCYKQSDCDLKEKILSWVLKVMQYFFQLVLKSAFDFQSMMQGQCAISVRV